MSQATASHWDAAAYAANAAFVPALGAPVLALLDPQPGERVLDLGCGDGALTAGIAAADAEVVGVDGAPDMIAAALARGLDARVMDGEALTFAAEFDAAFSNAALHWMIDAPAVAAGVFAGIAVAVVSPFAPLLLGPTYAGTQHELLLLSVLPVLLAFSYVGADILLGSDHVVLRTLILLAMPVVSVAMCFVFVPSYGAMGAVYATLCTNAIAATVSWSAAAWVSRGGR